jgi:sarcosine oxidase subunit alpha
MSQPRRLAADAAHQFGGIAIDRSKPLQFRLDGRGIGGFAGDTVLSALLASGIDTFGRFADHPLALTERLAPLASEKGRTPLPVERLPATDGADLTTTGRKHFSVTRGSSLSHLIDGIPEPPWLRDSPAETVSTDLLIVGGGVAGLAAAEAAAQAGHSVVLAERRPWLGGDARYFGQVGDEASPETVTNTLIARLATLPSVTLMTCADAFAVHGSTARLHRILDGRSTVTAVTAKRIVLATGSVQRLPIFSGNRLPGVMTAIGAYHLAKRYGVALGTNAIVATQSNYGYRLALRLNDAGVSIRRIADQRVNAQSRFVDFAKASGLKLAGGQIPVSAVVARSHGLQVSFATFGTASVPTVFDTDCLIVSGPFQPDLALWMLSGGRTAWADGRLEPRGHVEHVALAGAATGYRSMAACLASGRAAAGEVFGGPAVQIDDAEIGAAYETPEASNMIAPAVAGAPAFLESGASLIVRAVPGAKPVLTRHAQAPSIGDVAASVELELTSPADAGAVAEERGAPGGDLVESSWKPSAGPNEGTPPWLAVRFAEPERVHLIVDGKRRFERGALVYANTSPADPQLAIGVIEDEAPAGQPGGIALIAATALAQTDRFIVEMLDGPSPARVARH